VAVGAQPAEEDQAERQQHEPDRRADSDHAPVVGLERRGGAKLHHEDASPSAYQAVLPLVS